MPMRSRRVCSRSPRARWQHNHCLMIGLVAGFVLLAGCGMSGSTGGSSGSHSVTSGQVTVATNKQQYGSSETVVVTITNGLPNAILAPDHQSDCTVVTIERLANQTWQPQNMCQLKSATRLVSLPSGSTLTPQVRPPALNGAVGWLPGTYRVAFEYRQNASDQGSTVYSASFTIVQ
jgi:hypothetical protein